MIPWISAQSFFVGPITVQVWGLCVAFGIVAATWVAAKKARRDGLNGAFLWDLSFWVMVSAFLGARLFQLIYVPEVYLAHPALLLRVWEGGFSETGGIIGALIGSMVFLLKSRVDVWGYAGCAAYGLPLGFGIGRIGCFLIHDHPGTLTHSLLGVNYPDGVRHDHGLYLSIEGFLLFLLFVVLDRKKAAPKTFVALFFVIHGMVRFGLDFLRAVDVRYWFLTPAQYAAIVFVFLGVWLLVLRPECLPFRYLFPKEKHPEGC